MCFGGSLWWGDEQARWIKTCNSPVGEILASFKKKRKACQMISCQTCVVFLKSRDRSTRWEFPGTWHSGQEVLVPQQKFSWRHKNSIFQCSSRRQAKSLWLNLQPQLPSTTAAFLSPVCFPHLGLHIWILPTPRQAL